RCMAKPRATEDKPGAGLRCAADDGTLVRVRRTIRGADKPEGFVVGLGARWVLLAVLDPSIVLDGFAAIQLADIAAVVPVGGRNSFVGRALTLQGHWPP